MARRIPLLLVNLLAWAPPAGAQPATEAEIVLDESVLAVVTHKAGFASGQAHDHLVVAGRYEAHLAFSPDRPEATTFSLAAAVADLLVDDPALQQRWFPDIRALGVLSEPFGGPSEEQRAKIRKAMLGDEQLDAERHPVLAARLLRVVPEVARVGSVEHAYRLAVEISLHGVTREETFTARMHRQERGWRLEALGTLRSSDYGIEPYSAFLGAVRNEDEIHVLVALSVAD